MDTQETQKVHPVRFYKKFKVKQILLIGLLLSIFSGVATGYSLAKSSPQTTGSGTNGTKTDAKHPTQDRRTFRDFAEGKITKKPEPSKGGDYEEGTHLLIREGADPVALTSSVVDLSLFEGKKIKVYGETQKAIKEGWLMDAGRVEESK